MKSPNYFLFVAQFRNLDVPTSVRLGELLTDLQGKGEEACREFYRALHLHVEEVYHSLPTRLRLRGQSSKSIQCQQCFPPNIPWWITHTLLCFVVHVPTLFTNQNPQPDLFCLQIPWIHSHTLRCTIRNMSWMTGVRYMCNFVFNEGCQLLLWLWLSNVLQQNEKNICNCLKVNRCYWMIGIIKVGTGYNCELVNEDCHTTHEQYISYLLLHFLHLFSEPLFFLGCFGVAVGMALLYYYSGK